MQFIQKHMQTSLIIWCICHWAVWLLLLISTQLVLWLYDYKVYEPILDTC